MKRFIAHSMANVSAFPPYRVCFLIFAVLTAGSCGSGMGVLRQKMQGQSRILVDMTFSGKINITRAGKNMGLGSGSQVQPSKIVAANILKLREKFATAIRKEFPNATIDTTATVKIPIKKDTFFGMPIEVPDYSGLNYDMVLTLTMTESIKEEGTTLGASMAGASYGAPYGYEYRSDVMISGYDPKAKKPLQFGLDSQIAGHRADLGKGLSEQKLDPQLVSAAPDTATLWQVFDQSSNEKIAAFTAELKKN